MLEGLSENIYVQRHPLRLAGCRFGRVVTVIRLASGKLVVHSTANFSPEHVAEIRELGEPGWLVEATNFHDTLAAKGRAAFPEIPYLAPSGFPGLKTGETGSLSAPVPEWDDALHVIELEGMPRVREHVLWHRPSKTLIIADLFFNFPPTASRWTLSFLRAVAGIREYPGMSRLVRFCIKDREAFSKSLQSVLALEIDRIVVGHGEPIEEDAKAKFAALMRRHGLVTS